MLNAELLPKAEFYDAVVDSKTAVDLGTGSRLLGTPIGRNGLLTFSYGVGSPSQLQVPAAHFPATTRYAHAPRTTAHYRLGLLGADPHPGSCIAATSADRGR